METLAFTASIVAPVFILVFVGYFIKRRGLINENFNRTASKVVFKVTLPALVFQKIATTNYRDVFDIKLVLYSNIAILAFFIISWIIGVLVTRDGKNQGAFIQGAFRSNFSIIGFALINNAFGPDVLARAAIMLAFIMPLYNVLCIIALTVPLHKEGPTDIKKILIDIVTNPLIIAVLVSLPFSFLGTHFHPIISTTIGYLAQLTLPLALLSIGGSLSFHRVKQNLGLVLGSSSIKIVFMPLLLTWTAVLFGFKSTDLGILFFLFGCPTAVVSYIMADAMGSNGKLAGDIVFFTTLGSIFTLSAGIILLKALGFF